MQLGKLDVSHNDQDHSCKTSVSEPQSHQRVAGVKQNEFPVIIAEWDRNAREVMRVALDYYNGRHTINARVWYHDDGGLKPGKAGVTLAIKHLPALADALAKAEQRARDLGLIEGGAQ
ncbi:MAG: transcriptional coactivator p15/PC4 family protein [Pseudolabrys sp.]|nr:transcriptional coactivator p15/PC4 family protein [Pseudolabrys sp.]